MAKQAKKGREAKAGRGAQKGVVEAFYRPFETLAKPAKDKKGSAAQGPGAKGAAGAVPAGAKGAAPAGAKGLAPAGAKGAAGAPAGGAPEPPGMIDTETFAIYMAGVRTLGDRANRIPATSSRIERAAPPPPAVDLDAEARARMRSLVQEGMRFEVTDDGARIEGRRVDVDPRELRRLRRSEYAIDGSLDLHGLRAGEARGAVEAFVRKRGAEGDRVVAIVHGKGNHSPGGQGVLRGEIAAWLSQGHAARHVAAFATAPEPDGGAGALLVLLAR